MAADAMPAFVSLTQPPATKLLTTNIPAPTGLYVTDDDFIRVVSQTVLFTQPFFVQYKLLRASDGVISIGSQLFTNPSDGSIQIATVQLTEGFLLAVSVFPQILGSSQRGSCFASIQLGSGSINNPRCVQALAADYITANYGLSWPGGPVRNTLDEHGSVQRVVAGNPGAGNEWNIPVTAGMRWKLQSLTATLTTSAAVAQRAPALQLRSGITSLMLFPTVVTQAQSLVQSYSATPGSGGSAANGSVQAWTCPEEIWLSAANGPNAISSFTASLQAGDAWTSINSAWQMWIES